MLVLAGDADRIDPGAALRLADPLLLEIHQHAAVGGPGRPLDMGALSDDALTAAVGPHDADIELAALTLGEGDQVAARRPDRIVIAALAEGDSMRAAAAGIHDIDLGLAAAIGFEDDLAAVRRI